MKLRSYALRIFCLVGVGLLACATQAAEIGAFPQPARQTPEQARCQAMGDGILAVEGSSTCVRISGYVSSGFDFVEPGLYAAPTTGPFAPRQEAKAIHARASEPQFTARMGSGRVYVEGGNVAP